MFAVQKGHPFRNANGKAGTDLSTRASSEGERFPANPRPYLCRCYPGCQLPHGCSALNRGKVALFSAVPALAPSMISNVSHDRRASAAQPVSQSVFDMKLIALEPAV